MPRTRRQMPCQCHPAGAYLPLTCRLLPQVSYESAFSACLDDHVGSIYMGDPFATISLNKLLRAQSHFLQATGLRRCAWFKVQGRMRREMLCRFCTVGHASWSSTTSATPRRGPAPTWRATWHAPRSL